MGTSPSSPAHDPARRAETVEESDQRRARLEPGPLASPILSSSAAAEAVSASLQRWRGWTHVEAVLEARPEVELYLAGGAVRDVLHGRSAPKDLDCFFEERDLESVADELGRHGRIERTIFGSPRWFPAGDEGGYCDLMAIQRFSNGRGRCRDIVEILQQFDFTANAVAIELRGGRFFDPVGGVSDLRRRILRLVRFDTPDEPVVPGHDLSRTEWLWLRLVHYTAHLGLEIEPQTLNWLRDHRSSLRKRARVEAVFQRLHPGLDEVIERYGLG